MSRRARWSLNGPAGSPFHELIVIPTLVPQLLREVSIVPGRYQADLGTAGSPLREEARAAPPTADSEPEDVVEVSAAAGNAVPQVDPHLIRRFFVHVTTSRTKTVKNGKTEKREKHEESKSTTVDYPVLAMTRSAFIAAALAAHGLQERYDTNVSNGPPMAVFWTGSVGGKNHPPMIQTDQEWAMLLAQLRITQRSIMAVQVKFTLDNMAPWARVKRPLSPSLHDELGEIMYGTAMVAFKVPSVSAYSAEQTAHKDAAKLIEQAWACAVYQGTCYVMPSLEHVQIHDVWLLQWSSAVAGGRAPTEPPPPELLSLWTDKPTTVKARGRTGPHPAAEAGAVATADSSAAQLLTALVPLLTTVVQRSLSSPVHPATPASSRGEGHGPAPPSAHHPGHDSSPPPEVDEELTRCLEAFAHERRIPMQLIDEAILTLSNHSYTPDLVGSVPIEHLQQLLPEFAEGQLYALKRYADNWYNRVAAKRARRSL